MTPINETRLPGVGIRFDFVMQDGSRVIVINHYSGRCEIMRCSKSDPDTCHEVLRLTKEDARTLAELLGQSQVTEEVTAMRLSMRGLDIDWLPVGNDAQCAHCSLHDLKHQDDDSAAIVAVLRGESTIAGPPSTFVLEPGDIAVAVGTPSGIEKLGELLSDR